MAVSDGAIVKATVLFCDIRNFTSLFENRDPIEAVKFANSVLGALGNVVNDHEGWVDRFTGDGFLAHFGIKQSTNYHADSACNAVLAMRKKLTELNANRYIADQPVVNIGIGIHSGELAFGSIQTRQLKQETVLGDVVNTAARIEEMTKYFMVDALVSESIYKKCKENYHFREMPLKSIPGKKNPVRTYWLTPMNEI